MASSEPSLRMTSASACATRNEQVATGDEQYCSRPILVSKRPQVGEVCESIAQEMDECGAENDAYTKYTGEEGDVSKQSLQDYGDRKN